jgi:tellurite resistance protein TehA-like permease
MNRILLKNLSPANFAFVMSSGIASLIFNRTGWTNLSLLFLIVGVIGYVGLISLFMMRLLAYRTDVLQDLGDIRKMFKYLTFSAGSNALAASCCFSGYYLAGYILGLIGIISTVVLTYTLICILFFHIHAPIQDISPFWLLLTIACNSSGIVISTFREKEIITNNIFLLIAFCFWTFGVFVYVIFMTLNIFRMLFLPFEGRDMDPCYWTCMGAAAIAVVDGSQFVLVNNPPFSLQVIKPFIEGMDFFLWAWGTTWIPILCLMELWKVIYFKIPFHYQPSLWAMVFPLGMYTAATDFLSFTLHLDTLQKIVPICLWITFFVWCLVAYMSRLNPFAGPSNGIAEVAVGTDSSKF